MATPLSAEIMRDIGALGSAELHDLRIALSTMLVSQRHLTTWLRERVAAGAAEKSPLLSMIGEICTLPDVEAVVKELEDREGVS